MRRGALPIGSQMDVPMAARSNALVSALANAVKLNPRLSAGLAFEIGVMVGAFVRAARGRKGIAGATATLIDAVPLIAQAMPARTTVRKVSARKAPARKRPTKRKAA
jgi:hypothetical protein